MEIIWTPGCVLKELAYDSLNSEAQKTRKIWCFFKSGKLQEEDWQTSRRYLRMDYFEEDRKVLDERLMEEIMEVKQGVKINE